MKGFFSIWSFFGLTLWIDVFTHIFRPKKSSIVNPYKPLSEVSVIIPIHKEPEDYVIKTIRGLDSERYPLKNIIICGDSQSRSIKESVKRLAKKFPTLQYVECPHLSKAMKLNYVASTFKELGEYIYVRDCRVTGSKDCIEKMMSHFNTKNVAAVTSYGRLSIPRNFLSRSYFYGKSWINEIGRFRKNAQEKRRAVFVVCGASTIYRTEVFQKHPMPYGSKTEDTYYTWVLQNKGYTIRVADDARVSAPEVDGTFFSGINGQIKQSYRWSSGTLQVMFRLGRGLFTNKRLAYSTIIPGFVESIMYAVPLFLIPLLFYFSPLYALGFLIGDTVFSLVGTLIIIPRKFMKTVYHYPQIFFFKYLNGLIFLWALLVVTTQALLYKTNSWSNEWTSPETRYISA